MQIGVAYIPVWGVVISVLALLFLHTLEQWSK